MRLIRRRCCGYWHHHGGDAVICCGYSVCEVSQPERLNAEGFSLSALSRGWSVSATPGMPTTPKKSVWRTRMLSPRKPIFASLRRIIVGWHDTEGFASLHPRLRATRSARAFDLSGRAAVWFLPRIFTDSVMVALPRIYAGDCAGRKSR